MSAAPASAPTALTEIEPVASHLERQRLADADERDDREQADDVVLECRRSRPTTPAAMPSDADEADERARGGAACEKKRGPCSACGRDARRSAALDRGGGRDGARRDGSVRRRAVGSLGRGQRRRRRGARACRAARAAARRESRRARGCGPGASRGRRRGRPGGSSSFASAPSRGKPATPIEIVARIGSLEVSTSNARSATARRIRSAISNACSGGVSGQQDRELLAAEPRRDVVVAQLLRGRPRRCREHGVAGEVAVACC